MKRRKLGEVLDWAQRLRFVFDVVVAIASWKVVKKGLTYVPHISSDWASVIAWIAAAIILYILLVWWQQRPPGVPTTQSALMPQTVGIIPPVSSVMPSGSATPSFNAKEFFRTAYYSPLTAEAEKNSHLAARQNSPDNPEEFLCKLIGVGLVQFFHEITWLTIYKSQFDLLSDMNIKNGWMPLAEAKCYYDKAAAEYPEIYSKWSFSQWMDYVKGQQLLIEHPSAMLEITVRGKDFLKYLTHWGRSVAWKKG